MADNVIIYWVGFKGTLYAANVGARTYVAMSSMERVEAAKRALDFAGIPHKDWPHGQPSTMEEFGVEIRSDELLTSKVNGQKMTQSAALEWIDLHGYNADTASAALVTRSYPYQIAVQESTGRWYAYAPGVFFHIVHNDHYNWLRAARLVPDASANQLYNDDMIQFIHDECARGGDPSRIEDVAKPPPPKTHTVVQGETLSTIAALYKTTWQILAELNKDKVPNPDSVPVGTVLNLPK